MARSLNTVILSGYLGRDPDMHTFDNGDQVTTLRLAVSNAKKQGDEWVDDTLWVDCKVYGARAESVAQYLVKGSFVMVEGSLGQPRSWDGDDGVKRFTMVVNRCNVIFGPKAESNGGGGQSRAAAAPAAASTGGNMFDGDDQDIPF
jgi:single-strand DNA-binding protein